MHTIVRPAVVMVLTFTLLTGIAYPLAVTGVAQVLYPNEAAGSPLARAGKVVGSALVGQAFTSDRYFHGRASAAGSTGYDASASSGSNLGPLSAKLVDRVKADTEALRRDGALSVPGDAVTASGSGLDPHISPAYAEAQIARIARARGVPEDRIRAIVAANAEQPELGVLGVQRVNVLRLNLAIDETLGGSPG